MTYEKSNNNKTFVNQSKQQDSITRVYPTEKRFHGGRKVVSFRCNEKLWKALKSKLKADSVTTCHIMEAMISAFLGAYPDLVNNCNTITIENLHVRRVVEKHRRVAHEFDVTPNFYNVELGDWSFVENAVLNVNAHAQGCGCSVCRKQ